MATATTTNTAPLPWTENRIVLLGIGLGIYLCAVVVCAVALVRFLRLNRHPLVLKLVLVPFRDYDSAVVAVSDPWRSMASQKLFVHVVLLVGYLLCTLTYALELAAAVDREEGGGNHRRHRHHHDGSKGDEGSARGGGGLVQGLDVCALFGFYALYFFAFAMVLYQWGTLLVLPELGGVLVTVGFISLLPRLLLGFGLLHAGFCCAAVADALLHRGLHADTSVGYKAWYIATIASRLVLSGTFLGLGVLLYRRVKAVFGTGLAADRDVVRGMLVLVLCLVVCVSCFLLNAIMVFISEWHPSSPSPLAQVVPPPVSLFLLHLTRNWIPNTVPLASLLYLNRTRTRRAPSFTTQQPQHPLHPQQEQEHGPGQPPAAPLSSMSRRDPNDDDDDDYEPPISDVISTRVLSLRMLASSINNNDSSTGSTNSTNQPQQRQQQAQGTMTTRRTAAAGQAVVSGGGQRASAIVSTAGVGGDDEQQQSRPASISV